MRKHLIVLIIILTSNVIEAQFIKEKSINAQIGYGLTMPRQSIDDIASSGFLIQGELVLKTHSWLELKPYAGFVVTNSNGKTLDEQPTTEFAESKAFLLGGKARLRAPIPWVAPYLEIGIGTSIGKFETFTAFTNISKNGFIYHIPFAFGLEIGRKHNFDIGFSYYIQPTVKQDIGSVSIGFSFPLNNEVKSF